MDIIKLIEKYYRPDSKAYYLLVNHSMLVAQKALRVAKRVEELNPDHEFVKEAAMLHDIGIFMTHAPHLGCSGFHPYISHGYLGRDLLEKEGLIRHALVCERHIGTGLTAEDIERNNLPLPRRDMMPVTVEEQIVCFADKFYSKDEDGLTEEKPVSRVREIISKYGEQYLRQFDEWLELFKEKH